MRWVEIVCMVVYRYTYRRVCRRRRLWRHRSYCSIDCCNLWGTRKGPKMFHV